MNELTVFKNEQFGEMRTVTIGEEIWFVGKDVAEILGYKNSKDALITHVSDEDKRIIQRSEIDDYVWLPYERAANNLKFVNDKRILKEAKKFLIENNYITAEE